MDNFDSLWKRIEQSINKSAEEAFALSDYIGRNPETAWNEHKAAGAHVEMLRSKGFEVEFPYIFETSYRTSTGRGKPAIALFAEYDALPEIGHGCGHNVHGVMSLLAAVGLKEVIGDIAGQVVLIGTPAEEMECGKGLLLNNGAFSDIDCALMIHSTLGLNVAHIETPANYHYTFTFKGRPAHAALEPWSGRSALEATMLFFHAIEMMRHHIKPGEAIVHGIIREGGVLPNIIPEKVTSEFSIRGKEDKPFEEVLEWILDAARGSALATQTEAEWEKAKNSVNALQKNPALIDLAIESFEYFGIQHERSIALSGSTDMGNVSIECPALHAGLSIADESATLHSKEFAEIASSDKVHPSIIKGAAVLARIAFRILAEKGLIERIGEDFRKGGGEQQL